LQDRFTLSGVSATALFYMQPRDLSP